MDNGRCIMTAHEYFKECERYDSRLRMQIKDIHRLKRLKLGHMDIDPRHHPTSTADAQSMGGSNIASATSPLTARRRSSAQSIRGLTASATNSASGAVPHIHTIPPPPQSPTGNKQQPVFSVGSIPTTSSPLASAGGGASSLSAAAAAHAVPKQTPHSSGETFTRQVRTLVYIEPQIPYAPMSWDYIFRV